MFTGIITDIGTIEALEHRGDLHARIGCRYAAATIALGASISCDGVCLTVTDRGEAGSGAWFDVDISAETLEKTNIVAGPAPWARGRRVNFERALRLGDEMGGHLVSGHVDGVARITEVAPEGESLRFVLEAPEALARFVAPKGSVALNGTSLTVNDVEGTRFGVNVIPHTQAETTWGARQQGDLVNLEIDTLARYVARMADYMPAGGSTR